MPVADTYEQAVRRFGVHRWWGPPLAVLCAAFGVAMVWFAFLLVATLVLTALGQAGSDEAGLGPPFVEHLLLLFVIALATPVVLLVAQVVQRRPAGTMHSVTGRIRWRWLGICTAWAMVVAVALILGVVLVEGSPGGPWLTVGWPRLLLITALLLVLVPLQAAGEEYATRGFLLQTLGAYHRWIGVLASALVFALLHGLSTWTGFAALFLGAVVWAVLVIRTGGLEVSIAAHASVNFLAMVLAGASGGLDVVDTTSAADATLEVAVLLLAADLVYAMGILGLLRLLARRRPAWVPGNRFTAPTGHLGSWAGPSGPAQWPAAAPGQGPWPAVAPQQGHWPAGTAAPATGADVPTWQPAPGPPGQGANLAGMPPQEPGRQGM